MFNNNINKPAITVFLPLTSANTFLPVAKTSFCRQKLFLPGRFFPRKKTGFYRSLAKTCQPWVPREVISWAMRKLGVEEWLVSAVMSVYTGAKTVVSSDNS